MYCVYTEWCKKHNYLTGFIAVPARGVSSIVNTVLEIKFVKRLWIKHYLGLQKVEGSRIPRRSTLESGKFLSPKHRLLLPPRR